MFMPRFLKPFHLRSSWTALPRMGVLTIGLSIGLVTVPAVPSVTLAMTTTTAAAADAPNDNSATTGITPSQSGDSSILTDHVRRALILDPAVVEANARVCQATHRLGIGRAEARPQVTANVTGSRQLASRIKSNCFSFNRTPAEKEIHESGAHHRQFEHRQKDNIYDGTVSLRVNVWDWGGKRANIDARTISRDIARYEATHTLEQRTLELFNLALRLRLQDVVLENQAITTTKLNEQIAAVQARFDAGVGRLSELREARLLGLDLEISVNRISAQRDQLVERLKSEFGLQPADADLFFDVYRANRPINLAHSHAEATEKAHILRMRQQVIRHEETQIKSARYPKFDAVMQGTIFDMTDYEDEYELVGKLEMSVPLYDGGAARERLNETAWRSREIKAALNTMHRDHATQLEQLTSRFNDIDREEAELEARLVELRERLKSLQAVHGKTSVTPQQLAQLEIELGHAKTRLIETQFEREAIRGNALALSEQLDDVLSLRNGVDGC